MAFKLAKSGGTGLMSPRLRTTFARLNPRLAVVVHDLAMVWLAWYLSQWLRYWMSGIGYAPPEFFTREMPVVIGAQGLILWWTGLYRGLWRFASLPDLVNILRASALGALSIALALFVVTRLEGVPRSVLLAYPFVVTLLLAAPRLTYRYWKDSRLDLLKRVGSKRVLVLGAGTAGESLLRELKHERAYRPVGLLDDNPALRGAVIRGVPVLGDIGRLPALAKEVAAELLVIAIPTATTAQMQRIVSLCERTGVPFRTVPHLKDVIAGRAQFNQLKEVAIEDLLGREQVELDWTAIRTGLAGHRVLVTGGGGSIGAELCRQVARLGVSRLIVFEQSEYNLYRIVQELREHFPALALDGVLGDASDVTTARELIQRHRPQHVFHAAAYKHVPLLEQQLREAVRNNVLGTRAIAEAAAAGGVESFVLISTDKAVNPVNVMGASKRVAELFCQGLSSHTPMRVITVRFGNVLDSAGSVVPLFREQIARGGPVTVTHADMERYFMTIPEACQLILQASALGQGGEIFALDMGEPVRIGFLAEQMIKLAGKRPGEDVAIVYTGLRPGEKLSEELFHPQEHYVDTTHRKIFLAQSRAGDWNALVAALDEVARAAADFDEITLASLLHTLVPEFTRDQYEQQRKSA
jgi:FlaA1/EpsC-like NDP-sugar epimerase